MRSIDIEGPLLSAAAMNAHKECGVWSSNHSSIDAINGSRTNKDIKTERSLLFSGIGAAAATRDVQVSVIDMSKGITEEVAKQIWDTAQNCGFFTVVGHNVPLDSVDLFAVPTRQRNTIAVC